MIMTDNEPAKLLWEPKDFTVGFRVSTEMLEDSSFTLGMLEERIKQCNQALAERLFNDAYDIVPEHRKIGKIGKLRRWLGWKLWGWAVSLNPDCYDD